MSTSAPASPPKTAVAWLDPDQVGFVRAIAAAAGIRLVGAGCSQLGRAREVAEALGSGVIGMDDLRTAVTTSDADVLLLASPGEFGAGEGGGSGASVGAIRASGSGVGGGIGDTDAESRRRFAGTNAQAAGGGLDDWAVLEQRRARGGAIFTIEPMPASVLSIVEHAPGEWASFAPSFLRSPAMRAASDVLAHLGAVHSIAAEFVSGAGEGSLGARLFDALEVVTALLGEPESVDAMYVWPGRSKIVHPVVGESLRGLQGVLTANLRFGDGRGATVLAGDASVGCAGWSRRLTLISEAGRMTVTDGWFEFVPAAGGTVDRSAPIGPVDAAGATADQIARALDPAAPATAPPNYPRILAAAGAALLSARTGEAESPETILRMTRSV